MVKTFGLLEIMITFGKKYIIMNLGRAIKQVREKKFPGVNQRDFSSQLGITQGYLSQVENSKKKPSVDLLEDVSMLCEIPLPVLFWFSVEESDINLNKLEAFKFIKPSVDEFLNKLI